MGQKNFLEVGKISVYSHIYVHTSLPILPDWWSARSYLQAHHVDRYWTPTSDAPLSDMIWKDIHHGQYHREDTATRTHPGT